MENKQALRGRPAVLASKLSNQHATENCVACGKFTAKTDRLPTVYGYAHVTCLIAKGVR